MENQPRKGLEIDQLYQSFINHSQSMLKMEVKVDNKAYQGDINSLKLNHQLQQVQFYFNVHHIEEEQNISFAQLKLEGHALTQLESHMDTLRLEGDPLVTKWEDFEIIIKSQFYPMGIQNTSGSSGTTLGRSMGRV